VTDGGLEIDGSLGAIGSISVTDATLDLKGTLTTAQLLNDFALSNTTIDISGLLINTGATLDIGAGSALGTIDLSGTIEGGVVHDAGGGLISSGGTLEGVTYEGTLDLSAGYTALAIAGGITLTGLNGAGPGTVNLTSSESFHFIDNTTTLNNATTNFAGRFQSVDLTGTGAVVTLGSALTFTQTGVSEFLPDADGIGDGIVNQGTINAGILLRGSLLSPPVICCSSIRVVWLSAVTPVELEP
jgi:hypothetical protein